jgi:hypothetical protein
MELRDVWLQYPKQMEMQLVSGDSRLTHDLMPMPMPLSIIRNDVRVIEIAPRGPHNGPVIYPLDPELSTCVWVPVLTYSENAGEGKESSDQPSNLP